MVLEAIMYNVLICTYYLILTLYSPVTIIIFDKPIRIYYGIMEDVDSH